MTDLLEARSRSERALRERLEATAAEGDLKARLASTRSQLEAVSQERDALVSGVCVLLFHSWCSVLFGGGGGHEAVRATTYMAGQVAPLLCKRCLFGLWFARRFSLSNRWIQAFRVVGDSF